MGSEFDRRLLADPLLLARPLLLDRADDPVRLRRGAEERFLDPRPADTGDSERLLSPAAMDGPAGAVSSVGSPLLVLRTAKDALVNGAGLGCHRAPVSTGGGG